LLDFAKNNQTDLLTKTLKDLKRPMLESYFETKVSNILKSVIDLFPEKLIELKLQCENSRVSKNTLKVLDAILPHLIRNAVDHGIESVEERVENNKSKIAELVVSMNAIDNFFELTVCDDGRGVDTKRLCERVIENKIMTSEEIQNLEELEKLMLIFTPGLSTASAITQISGRGVGMDAVYQAVKDVEGEIEVSSILGKETKFLIKLPLEMDEAI
jgi:chemotaxis protein histidine kinase CheA